MKTYHIRKNQKLFRPLAPIWPVAYPKGFEFRAVLDESLWFSADEVDGDKDRGDWLKLTGITSAFGRNNHRAALIAYRPLDVKNTFALTAYTNDKKGGWHTGGSAIKIKVVEAGEQFWGKAFFVMDWFTNTVQYDIESKTGSFSTRHDFDTPWHHRDRQIGGAHGGANNSPGPYGGRAVKDGQYQLAFNWIT